MVKDIPDMLTFPFTVWMAENGFSASHKKGHIILRRGNEFLRISLKENDKGYPMNEPCQKRFMSFCRAYLNRDKYFLDQLRMRGLNKMNNLSYQMVKA